MTAVKTYLKSRKIVLGLLQIALVILTIQKTPANATVTQFSQTYPYSSTSSSGYDSTGSLPLCDHDDNTPDWEIQVCHSSSAFNGIGVILGLGHDKDQHDLNIFGQAQFNENTVGQSPVTDTLLNQYLQIHTQIHYSGSLYRSDTTYADGYVYTYIESYQNATGGWNAYHNDSVYIFHAGTPGIVINLSVTNDDHTPIYGPISGKYSMLVTNGAVGIATDSDAEGYADFYNDPLYKFVQVRNMTIYKCDRYAECERA